MWIKVQRSTYGPPQAGKHANEFPKKKLVPHGYFEVKHTPGLWKHITHPIQFTLVVNNFDVKYTRRQDAEHLLGILETKFPAVSTNGGGVLYCGITLEWNYEERWLDISMPGYNKKGLQKYLHEAPAKPQHSPYGITPKKYDKNAHDSIPPNESSPVSNEKINHTQGIIGSILFYTRSVDSMFLVGLNSISM